jgi:hypothetical protein
VAGAVDGWEGGSPFLRGILDLVEAIPKRRGKRAQSNTNTSQSVACSLTVIISISESSPWEKRVCVRRG